MPRGLVVEMLGTATKKTRTPSFRWTALLDAIDRNEVVPIVGRGLSAWKGETGAWRTFDEEVAALLSQKLDEKIEGFLEQAGRAPDEERPLFTEEVALCFRAARGRPREAYEAFSDVLPAARNGRSVPDALQDLAKITALDLFLSVTFDDFLEEALRAVRPGATMKVSSAVRSGAPARQPASADVEVHHLFGYGDSFELFSEDRIRTVLDLGKKLENELADLGKKLRGRTLLILGCGFPDWLMRFFVLALLSASPGEDTRRPVRVVDASVRQDGALALFLETMEFVVYPGDSDSFVKELAEQWQQRRAAAVPTPRQGAKVVLSCHEADRDRVEPEAARLRAWGIDTEIVQSAQPLDAVKAAIQACSFYVACLSSHTIGLQRQERERLWGEWAIARARRETAGGAFLAYYTAIADEAQVVDEVSSEDHPLWRFSKRAGQDLALQLVEPLRKAGHLHLRQRAAQEGEGEPLVLFCIYGKADWDGSKSQTGVDDLVAYLEKAFRSTPWIRLTHCRDLESGTEWREAVDRADAVLLLTSPAMYPEREEGPDLDSGLLQAEHARKRLGQIPLYRAPFRQIDIEDALLVFKPLSLDDARPIHEWESADRAWASVARAVRLAMLDHCLSSPPLSQK